MPRITPLASVPTTTPDQVAAASVLFMPPGAELWVEGQVTAGSVSLRPYYWSDDLAAVSVLKGAWIPVGGDAISGTSPVSFAAASFGGAAQGSYPWRRAACYVVLVQEAAAAPTYNFVHLSTETSAYPV